MKINSITFKNHKSGWNISNLKLDNNLSLLVGASGVGKTQILRSISCISDIARGKSFNGIDWDIEFSIAGDSYKWEGEFAFVDSEDAPFQLLRMEQGKYPIIKEILNINGDNIIKRDSSKLLYKNQETVKLDNSISVIELLKEETLVSLVNEAFRGIYSIATEVSSIINLPVIASAQNDKTMGIDDIQKQQFLPPIDRLFLLKKNDLKEFDIVCDSFKRIFPLIDDIDFSVGSLGKLFENQTFPIVKIKEKGVDSWIMQSDISSGMFRTLAQIITFVLAKDGDIILIDEFENGLGVNCIDQLADLVVDSDVDVQVIMTSHHPYIINAIPYSSWKIVTRKNCTVNVHTAEELNIGDHSRHDAFIQLIQSSAYKTGIA